MTKKRKLSIFQFKIIYYILPHRVLYYKMKITDSDLCLYCGSQETLQPIWLQFWRPKVSSLKLLHFNFKISHLQVQDRFQIPYFSSLYRIIERKTTRIQSGCRSKQGFTKIPNMMGNSLTLVG